MRKCMYAHTPTRTRKHTLVTPTHSFSNPYSDVPSQSNSCFLVGTQQKWERNFFVSRNYGNQLFNAGMTTITAAYFYKKLDELELIGHNRLYLALKCLSLLPRVKPWTLSFSGPSSDPGHLVKWSTEWSWDWFLQTPSFNLPRCSVSVCLEMTQHIGNFVFPLLPMHFGSQGAIELKKINQKHLRLKLL